MRTGSSPNFPPVVAPDMSPWLQRSFEFIVGGPQTGTAEMFLRGALFGCSLFASIQLLTMVGTRWGNRNAMSKAFFLSMLIHLCLGLGGAILEEHHRVATAANPEAVEEQPRARIREVRIAESDSPPPAKEDRTPAWQKGLSFPTSRFTRPSRQEPVTEVPLLPPVPERAPQAELPLEMPRVALSEPQPRTPAQNEPASQPTRATAASPPVDRVAELTEPRPDATKPPPSRQRLDRAPSPSRTQAAERPTARPPTEPPVDLARVDAPAAPAVERMDVRPRPESVATDRSESGAPGADPVKGTGKGPRRPTGPPVEKAPEVPVVRGVVRGIVTDSATGAPLPSAVIRFDQHQGEPLTTVSKNDGTYELRVTASSENSAITATRSGYLPESHNVRSADLQRKGARVDFSLRLENESVIAVEEDPVVHHLGNDRFDPIPINSKFQRKSEGTSYATEFRMSRSQVRQRPNRAVITMKARGIQCVPDIRINGSLLAKRTEKSPADGSYGALTVPFDPVLLREGANEIRIDSVDCNGDLDDFEFVNLQIRLSRPE